MSRWHNKNINPQSVTYGIPAEEIARICQVGIRTARRWKSGESAMPKTAEMLLAGDLGMLDREWRGWKIRKGQLISPEGWMATPGHVRSLQMMGATLGSYRRENASLKAAVKELEAEWDAFEEQPTPSNWEVAIK
jgi:uncharacterized protein DUF3653